jgi:hypothetical protein
LLWFRVFVSDEHHDYRPGGRSTGRSRRPLENPARVGGAPKWRRNMLVKALGLA